MLHKAHPGMSNMKSLARCYVWWPKIDRDIELCVKAPPVVPLYPCTHPSQPWSRIHIDHAGPFIVRTCLLVIDAYTKWLDVHITSTTFSSATIEALRKSFSKFGLPEVLVSDNTTGFTSEEFEVFVKAIWSKARVYPSLSPRPLVMD